MTEVITWSGWAGGLAVGIFTLVLILISGNFLGVSSGYGNVCSYLSKAVFFHKGIYAKPNNWRLWFTIGLPLGGLMAALTSPGDLHLSLSLGQMYDAVLPQAGWAKAAVLTLGGILLGYGARLSGGCTSGQTITGVSLLKLPSIVASMGFFAGGVIMVQLLFSVFAV